MHAGLAAYADAHAQRAKAIIAAADAEWLRENDGEHRPRRA